MTDTALTTRGGTRAWSNIRAGYQLRLDQGEVFTCRHCQRPVMAGMRWSLGHTHDRALGGTDHDGLAPEHRRCSDASGGRLKAKLADLRRKPTPSRSW